MSKVRSIRLVILLAAVGAAPTQAQQTDPLTRLQWYENHVAMTGQSMFSNLPWQFLGATNMTAQTPPSLLPA